MQSNLFIILFLTKFCYAQMSFPDQSILDNNKGLRFSDDDREKFNLNSKNAPTNYYANLMSDNIFRNKSFISNGINNFALNLNKKILNGMVNPTENNIILSPLSLAGALALLLLGSTGKTYNELAHVLGFFNDISESKNIHKEFGKQIQSIINIDNTYDSLRNISYANAIFLQNDFIINHEYEKFIKNIYNSEIILVDYKNQPEVAQRIINRWVFDQTNGKIQNILQSIPNFNTQLIITSALYFKAEWEKFFLNGLTKRSKFTPNKFNPEHTLIVDMMANEGQFLYHKSREHNCVIVGLPYKGNKTMMYVIKPLDSTRKSLKQIINDMTSETLNGLLRRMIRQSTIVLFPKMKLSSTYSLKSVLEEMGIQSLFSYSESNLALLTNPPPYSVSSETEDNDKLIFTRLGEGAFEESDCMQIIHKKDSTINNCTTFENVDGKSVKIVDKKIDDKIGRIIKRNIIQNKKIKRQLSNEFYNPGLYVDEVLHSVDISITETGTEAAAATMVLISRDGRRPVFVADEPFIFLIRDEETYLPLFSGIIYNPLPNYR